jgi:hypothetical protein
MVGFARLKQARREPMSLQLSFSTRTSAFGTRIAELADAVRRTLKYTPHSVSRRLIGGDQPGHHGHRDQVREKACWALMDGAEGPTISGKL